MLKFASTFVSVAVFFGISLLGLATFAQTTSPQLQSTPKSASPELAASTASKPAKPATAPKVTKPAWTDLIPEQQAALSPLQAEWPKISETQKRKWLEVSKNFGKLQVEEQKKLHSRMRDWVALSPQQRAQARLNFSAAKTLTPDEKQKQWQAYQSLSPVDKQKLTAKAKDTTPNSAALANKPQNKTQPVSKLPSASSPSAPSAATAASSPSPATTK